MEAQVSNNLSIDKDGKLIGDVSISNREIDEAVELFESGKLDAQPLRNSLAVLKIMYVKVYDALIRSGELV